jgi:hypothetical protein
MSSKYHGSIETLINAIKTANIPGEWQSGGGKQTFRSHNGGIMNWWPSNGTVNFQGKEPDRTALQQALHEILAHTDNNGSPVQHSRCSTHTYAATLGSFSEPPSVPPAIRSNGHENPITLKADLTPLLRDLLDVFANQGLVLMMVNGVPRIATKREPDHYGYVEV